MPDDIAGINIFQLFPINKGGKMSWQEDYKKKLVSVEDAAAVNEPPRCKQRGIITDLLFYSSSQTTGNSILRD